MSTISFKVSFVCVCSVFESISKVPQWNLRWNLRVRYLFINNFVVFKSYTSHIIVYLVNLCRIMLERFRVVVNYYKNDIELLK